MAAVSLACCLGSAQSPRHPSIDGFSADLSIDYDGSRFRTAPLHAGVDVEWRGEESWISLELDGYPDFSKRWQFSQDLYAGITAGTALFKSHEERLYINASFNLSGPSQLADRGIDLTPEISLAKGLTRDWWLGGELAGVISTSRNEGNRQGYISLAAWAMWFSRWLPNESDAFKLGVWAATNEVPEDGNALSFSLNYEFDINDHLDAIVGIGAEPCSPWGHHGAYVTTGLRWQF